MAVTEWNALAANGVMRQQMVLFCRCRGLGGDFSWLRAVYV